MRWKQLFVHFYSFVRTVLSPPIVGSLLMRELNIEVLIMLIPYVIKCYLIEEKNIIEPINIGVD